MVNRYDPNIKPGILEVYCGPMKSGKTRELIHRIDNLHYIKGCNFILIKPALDTRSIKIQSRFGSLSSDCILINENKPEEILEVVKKEHQLIAIDEAQFFKEKIISIVESLLQQDKNVIISGLDLDFRGEPFGQMHHLLARADIVHKLTGICDFDGCGAPATRTQRLVDGQPASYHSPIILIGDATEGYQCRCLKHHEVPDKPN
jgi:thymidine kinase